jgi:hypothetical protein
MGLAWSGALSPQIKTAAGAAIFFLTIPSKNDANL